ncbi:hypothetical protein C4577_02250 [Candidatus Parcubacteria bacterium]|nr:MAG: hypothetical protein C4577_02250 [Candidatus Parcubacteria bacterium]
MKPIVEELEARCVLNAPADLGTIGSLIEYGPIEQGNPVPWVTMPPPGGWAWSGDLTWPWTEGKEYWSISAAMTQPDMWTVPFQWPEFVGAGEWSVFSSSYAVDSPMNPFQMTLQRFTLPYAESVGIAITGNSVTVYQVAVGSLWSVTTFDHGANWTPWQEVVNLTNPPAPTGLVPSLAPFGWLADMNAYEPGPDFDGDGWPDAPGVDHALVVYGTIFANEDGTIRVGFINGNTIYSGLVTDGSLTTEEVDEFFQQPDLWEYQTNIWGSS